MENEIMGYPWPQIIMWTVAAIILCLPLAIYEERNKK